MSRLLFAAARGARIGWKTLSSKWYPAVSLTGVQSEFGQDAYRIHPDDEHLQYGPISTALREFAINNSSRGGWEGYLALAVATEFTEYFTLRDGDEEDYPLFYLILAEFLADSGL